MKTNTKNRTTVFLIFVLILVAGAYLRCVRIDEPFGGYHALNEAWYATQARNFEQTSIWNPTVSGGLIDYKVRPVYAILSWFAMRAVGFSEAAPRLVSVFFSLLSLLWIYLIGCRIGGRAAGLLTAAFLAVCPVYVVLGRQAQPDAAYVSFALGAAWLFLISNGHRREALLKLAAGVLWGLSCFTKNFGVLLLPGLLLAATLEKRSLKWINRRIILFLIPAVIIPAPFVFHHLLRSPALIKNVYEGSAFALPTMNNLLYMIKEIFWGASPAVFCLGLLGLYRSALRRGAGWWPAALAAPFSVLYFFLFVHSYYMLAIIPFLALGAAMFFRDAATIKKWSPLIAALLALTAFQTVMNLSGLKWGQSRFMQLCNYLGTTNDNIVLVVDDQVYNNYRALFFYYLPGAVVLPKREVKKNTDGTALLPAGFAVYIVDFNMGRLTKSNNYQTLFGNELLGLSIYGHTLIYHPENRHSFIPHHFEYMNRPGTRSGFIPVAFIPSLILTRKPDGYIILYENGQWVLRPAPPADNNNK